MPAVRAVFPLLACGAGILAFSGCGPRSGSPPPPLSFNQAIEPILSENCFQCHGPDPGSRKAGMRLDRREFAFVAQGKNGPVIVPGQPDLSPLIRRIESREAKFVMPPAETHRTLKPGQIALLRRWVSEGAKYEEHWSYIPPARPPVPATARKDWARNPIDAFVLARLEREALPPSPPADAYALIRRVTYDLTGLPPTPGEVDAFVWDRSERAYEKLVDRLLASPRFGEHRARYWLDAARYGDTHGLHLDNYRSVWPYRDYVINSYNRNKPFDQFVREQLAGDLMDPDNVDQVVATAFVRAGVSTGEGGSIPEELRVANQRERTEAFGAVFLGLTTGCAVCHDHKFDPISQRDFYRLTAFFNNLKEFSSDANLADWPPSILVPKPDKLPAYNQALRRRAAIQRQIDARRARARELIAAWLKEGGKLPRAVPAEGLSVRLRFDEGKGAVLANSAPAAAQMSVVTTGGTPVWGEDTWFWPSCRISDTGTWIVLPEAGDREWNQPFSVGTWVRPYHATGAEVKFGAIASRNQGSRGWELFFDHGKCSFRLVHRWPGEMILVETPATALLHGRWNHVLATYDGSGKASGLRLYLDGQPAPMTVVRDGLRGGIRTVAALELGCEHDGNNPLAKGCLEDFRFYNRTLSPEEAARIPWEDHAAEIVRRPMAEWTEDDFKVVSDFYFAHADEPARRLTSSLSPIQKELDQLAEGGAACLVCEDTPGLAYADVLTRGVYAQRVERVRPGVPHFLPQLPAKARLDRLALADWVVSPANPLTARVTVNRMWQELFGKGLVETTADFGLLGARPSHPELLDWLAVDFRESGWDVKRFYRQIVLSATYRQDARELPSLKERDPGNVLLARGPRFRMDAEMIRDTALSASGLLASEIGGPSVRPYQPDGVWENGTLDAGTTHHYVGDHGNGLYRRSLYTFWKRMVLMPNMEAFDAPARDGACTQRQRSNTPLQALVAMNDPQWLEAARRLGEKVLEHAPGTEERLDYLGRLLLARPLQAPEKQVLSKALSGFAAQYAGRDEAAAQLVAVGESRRDSTLAAKDLAPWMLVASVALNLDATLNK